MVQRFNKKNLPTKKSLKINGLVLGFFLVIAVLYELCWPPISLTLWHLYKGGTPPNLC